jgi:hypothetical protein
MGLIRALTSKIRVTDVLRAHWETLSIERQTLQGVQRTTSTGDLVTFFGFPVALGLTLALLGIEAPKPDPLLSSVSILTGLLFALIVMVFDQVKREANRPSPAAGNDPLVDAWQLLANVSWAILASLMLLAFMFGAVLFTDEDLAPWLTGTISGLFLHLVLTLLMVLKRVFLMAKRIAGPLLSGRR